jgi:hypothetical protein
VISDYKNREAGRGCAGVAGGIPFVEPFEPSASPPQRDERGRFVAGHPRLPRRRPGGQVRNLNSAGKAPWRVYWRRRALRPEDRWVLQLVQDYIPPLEADKGGPEEITAGERRLLELAAAARVCWLLAVAAPIQGSRAEAARFMNVERQSLEAIGLERRAKSLPTLAAFVAERAAASQSAQGEAVR